MAWRHRRTRVVTVYDASVVFIGAGELQLQGRWALHLQPPFGLSHVGHPTAGSGPPVLLRPQTTVNFVATSVRLSPILVVRQLAYIFTMPESQRTGNAAGGQQQGQGEQKVRPVRSKDNKYLNVILTNKHSPSGRRSYRESVSSSSPSSPSTSLVPISLVAKVPPRAARLSLRQDKQISTSSSVLRSKPLPTTAMYLTMLAPSGLMTALWI
jgi:hypothetical protein